MEGITASVREATRELKPRGQGERGGVDRTWRLTGCEGSGKEWLGWCPGFLRIG